MPVDRKALAQARKNIEGIDSEALEHAPTSLSAEDVVSTGSIAVDTVTGSFGFTRGRVTEVNGWEHSGKTTLMMMAAATAQRHGNYVAYGDIECALDLNHAKRIGFDYEDDKHGMLFTPRTAEDTIRIVWELIHAKADLIIIDSVPALVAEEELKGDIGGQSRLANRARILAQALPKFMHVIKKTKTALVLVNQFRENFSAGSYGPKHKSAGGVALRYFASMRLALTQIKKSQTTRRVTDVLGKDVDVPVASLHEVEVIKSKTSSPYRKLEFIIRFDDKTGVYGIDNLSTLIQMSKNAKVVEPRGNWIQFNGTNHNGEVAFYQHLLANPDEITALRQGLRDKGVFPQWY